MIWILFALLVALVAFHAANDATLHNDYKKISHLMRSLFMATVLLLVVYYPGETWKDHIMILIIWYGINRFFLFDPVWNITHNLCNYKSKEKYVTIDYIGETGWWDIFIQNLLIKIKMSNQFWFWVRCVIWVTYTGYILYTYKL